LLEADMAVSSSKGLSSTEPELALERLSVRGRAVWKGEVWFGDAERPMVVRESRRRWALTAAVVMGPGYAVGVGGWPLELALWPKRP
jgi:hypothetical protein